VIHRDHDVTLHDVDLAHNATAGRADRERQAPTERDLPLPKTAATRAFERDLGSILGPDGGFIEPSD
jgi:hypothetical protein